MKDSKILFALIEGGGNVTPMLGLARRLIEVGHSILCLSEPCLKHTIEEAGASFIPFEKHFTRTDRKEDLFKDWNASKIHNPVFDHVMFGPAPDVIDQCIEVIRTESIDLLVVDVLIFPAIIAAEYLALPKIVVFHMPEFLPGPNRPPGNMGLRPGKGFYYRLRDRFLAKLMTSKFDEYKTALNQKLASLSVAPLKHTLELFDRADLRLIQTTKSFDVPIEPVPKNVRYTGPELDDPDWVIEEKWVNPWPDQDPKPLVVISFSSTFQNQAKVLQNCITALSQLPVKGIVTLGPAMDDHEFIIPDNVVVTSSVKHSLLFPFAHLLITHGGHGTIIRALSYGLPIICLPMGRDQDDNAIKVAMKGCGIKRSPRSGPPKIQKAVHRILGDSTFRINARKMQDEINKPNNMEKVIGEINDLINYRKAMIV